MSAVLAVAEPRGGPLPDHPFLAQLVALIRANDGYGAWEGKGDRELLAEFVVTREERRLIPIIADPDPDVLWRIETFYTAVGLCVARASGCEVSPMSRISYEGFGRFVLLAGKLVVLSRHLRDVHRFGFESFAVLNDAGAALTAEAIATIEAHPDAARA